MNATLESLYERLRPFLFLAPDDEARLNSVCVHEMGHYLAALKFKLEPDDLIVAEDAGVVVHRPGTPLQNAAVSWAGIMAECLLNTLRKNHPLSKAKLTPDTLLDWISKVPMNALSSEDRRGIESHESRYESAKLAFEILSQNLELLRDMAQRRAERSREKFAAMNGSPAFLKEWELSRFEREQNETASEKRGAEQLRRASESADDILATLPPCKIPAHFSFESFIEATGATEQEVEAFVTWKITSERNEIGLGGAPRAAVEIAMQFFREHAVENRERFVIKAKEFCAWRERERKQA